MFSKLLVRSIQFFIFSGFLLAIDANAQYANELNHNSKTQAINSSSNIGYTSETKRHHKKEILIIDDAVEDKQALLEKLPADIEVLHINARENGLKQIAKALSGFSGIDAIHLVSHGAPGRLLLGNASVDQTILQNYNSELSTIGSALSVDGDILLYGCNVAANAEGESFVAALAKITGVDVAASNDITGSDGDWDLEQSIGDIDNVMPFTLAALANYQHNLATFTFTGDIDTGPMHTSTASDGTTTVTITSSSNDVMVVDGGGYGNSSGMVVLSESAGSSTSMTLTFNTAIDLTSLHAFESNGLTAVWRATSNTGSAITQTVIGNLGTPLSFSAFTGITSVIITKDGGGLLSFGIDDIQFTVTPPNSVPSAPIIGTATAGNAQATVAFTAPASDGGSTITGYTVTSNPAGGVDVNAGTTSLSHTMTGLANGTTYTFTVKATNAVGTGAASLASNSVTPKASQTISFGGAPSMTYGGATGTVSATATSGLTVVFSSTTTGVCTVSGTTVTAVTGGTCIIAANQSGNTAYNAASQVTQSFAIAKASQSISFGGAPSMTYGGATGTVSATATSGLAVLFSSTTTGICTVSGTTVTAVTGGTCTIAANQAGNTNYNTALQVTQSFSIAKASQSISFGVAPSMTYGGTTGTVSATATSGLTPAFSSTTTGVCTISGTTVTAVTGGTCIIVANQAGNTAYNPASQVTQSFAIAKASQTISFGGAPSMTYGGATGAVSATATSGLTVVFNSTTTDVCTVSGTTVTAVTGGTCTIAANQAGNTNYNTALQVTQSFSIAKASQSISFGVAPSMTYGGTTGTVSATATSGLTPAFSSTTTGVCTISGTTVTAVTGGTCIIVANQAGNTAYNPASQVTQSFAIAKASQSISFGGAPSMTYGGATGTVSATATSGLAVLFSSTTTGICTVSGTTVTAVTVGTCIIAANQSGNAAYNAASQVTQSFAIAKASQSISFGGAPSMTYGGATGTVSATATSGLAVLFSSTTTGICTVSGTTVTAVTVGTCIIAANQAGNTAYNPASQVTQSFAIAKASQAISFGGAPSMTYGGATGTVSATATSGLTVVFSSTTTGVCTVSGTTVTAVTGGTCIIAANQAGNAAYNAAPQVTQSFAIAKASQSISFGSAPSMIFGGATGTVSGTATSGLTVVFSSTTTGVCTVSGATVTAVTAGTCIIVANQAGNTAYNAASQVTQSFAIAKASQAISFGGAPSVLVDSNGSVSATGGASGNAVTFSSTTTNICSIAGTTVTGIAAGTCIIAANQAGDTNYNAAPQVTQNITVSNTIPGAPTIGSATASNAQASVSFSAPVSNGGSVITAYTVTSSPGGFASSGCTASPCTVMGLTNGTSYSFKVTATNAVGTGGASASSNSVTPATIPDAPTIGAATGGETEATVSFIAPADDGGNAISSYTVTSSPDGIIASGTSSPLTVTGLTDGTAYTFTVVATNGIGDSLASGASNSVTPDSPPVLTAPVDVTINAVGLFTPVDTGTATAIDSTDGALTPTSDAPSHFAPGVHTVTWSVTDSASHTVTATQTINVIPLVGFSIDQTAREGDTVTIKAILNGMAVTYPVDVPYTVSGTSDASDHDLVDGVITIDSNLEASVTVSLVDDGVGEGDETLIVTMGTPTNAVKGATDIHTTTITEINLAPEVVLTADQSSGTTTLVTQLDGSVTVTATVTDSVGDTHSYDWSATDNALIDTDAVDDTFSFDPSSLPAGVYTLRVNVTDNNSASSEADLILNVTATAPVLTATDSDGDGIDDDIEGHGDDDNDDIVNYLDHGTLTGNVISGRHATANQFLMETEPGLKVRLGKIAFRAGKDSINVNMDDVTTHANDGAGAMSDNRYGYNSGMFDFVIHQLPAAGHSIRVVLAQQATIPVDAVYRKYANGVWQQFVEDTNNSLASATGEEGYCPPPGDAAYTAGLTEGDWCVQLTIEDGGPNDADGKANRSISDPGGVTEQPSIVSITGNGGGAISGWALILMSTVLVWRLRRQHQIAGSLLVGSVLLAGAGNANAVDESMLPSYVGISYLIAKSDERAGDFNAELAALGLNATVTQTDLSRSGYSPYIGYQYDETFGVEVAYVDLGEVTTRISGTSADINTFLNGPATVYPVTARGLSAALVVSNKVTPTGTLMAKIGVFDWKSDYTLTSATTSKSFETRDSNLFLALGMEMEFMPHVPVRFGWNSYRVKDIDVRAWELGVAYRF